jgi:hypothetical protein
MSYWEDELDDLLDATQVPKDPEQWPAHEAARIFFEIAELPCPRWTFSLHRLLTGEWQASFDDEANSKSGVAIEASPSAAILRAKRSIG